MTIQSSVQCLTHFSFFFCLFLTPLHPFFPTLITHIDINNTWVFDQSLDKTARLLRAPLNVTYLRQARLIFSQRIPMDASLVLMRLWSHFSIRLLSINERQWKAHHQQVSRSKSLKPFFTFTLRLRGICQEWLISSLRFVRECVWSTSVENALCQNQNPKIKQLYFSSLLTNTSPIYKTSFIQNKATLICRECSFEPTWR